jgi:acylphosphatase
MYIYCYLIPEVMEGKQLYRIHIRGYVQGVGFRWSAAREAKGLGITGFVRNLSDGSVYIEAEGYPDKLITFVGWCHKGPVAGYVESVETESSPPMNYSEFRIEH